VDNSGGEERKVCKEYWQRATQQTEREERIEKKEQATKKRGKRNRERKEERGEIFMVERTQAIGAPSFGFFNR